MANNKKITSTKYTENKRNSSNKELKNEAQGCDVTTKIIGDFGRWQCVISFLMSLLKLPLAWFQLDIVFLAPPQEFWCEKPRSFAHYSDAHWRDICCPKIQEHPCLIYDMDVLKCVPEVQKNMIPLVPCEHFEYDDSIFNRTIVSDWDLVCSRHYLVHVSQCLLMWGILVGSVFFGALADKFGRKRPLMIAILIQVLASFLTSILTCFWAFLLVRFILALASGGIGIISFVICMEVVSGKWRTTIPVLYHLPFGFGNAIMACLAYFLRDWRKLEFSMALLSSTFIFYGWVIPESPRWLLAKGRTEQAADVLAHAARINKRNIGRSEIIRCLPIEGKIKNRKNEPGFLAFMKSKNMRKKTILLSANWFCIGLAFYAFSQHLGSIGEDIFLTVSVSGILSTPGGLVCVYFIHKMGRKNTLILFQIATGVCFFLIFIFPKNLFPNDWPIFFFAGVGFAGMAGSVATLYLFSGELFPTLGRNVGVGGVNTFARIGSMMAPIILTLENLMNGLPMILLTIMSISQVLLVLPLPETKGCLLPDTLEEAENIDKHFCKEYRKMTAKNTKSASTTTLSPKQ